MDNDLKVKNAILDLAAIIDLLTGYLHTEKVITTSARNDIADQVAQIVSSVNN